jgi:uncharacterized membrane protein YkoI
MRTYIASFVAAALLVSGVAAPAAAQSRRDQESAREELKAGRTMPLREIERRVLPSMSGMQYLGPEYDPASFAYRLKFMRDGQVTWVDVDARTARILRVSK